MNLDILSIARWYYCKLLVLQATTQKVKDLVQMLKDKHCRSQHRMGITLNQDNCQIPKLIKFTSQPT